MLAPLSVASCLYWVPVPFAQNAVPELLNHSPEWDAPVILASQPTSFHIVLIDHDPLTFSWTLTDDGHQSPSTHGVEGETQWQQVTLQPEANFGEQTLRCVVTDGTTPVTYEWIVVGS